MSLVNEALRKYDEIRWFINMLEVRSLNRDKIQWFELPEPKLPDVVIGVDGGSRVVDLKLSPFYMVQAIAIVHYKHDKTMYEKTDKVWIGDLGFVLPPKYVEERAQLYREMHEAEVARLACSNLSRESIDDRNSLILLDGSLLSVIIHPRPGSSVKFDTVEAYLRKNLVNTMLPEDNILEWVDTTRKALLKKQALREEEHEILAAAIGFIEYLGKLEAYCRFLTKCAELGIPTVFVSKTSRSTEYFNNVLPDMYIYEKMTETMGYSKPRIISLSKVKTYPEMMFTSKLRRFFSNMKIYTVYSRLDIGAPVLKIEIPVTSDSEPNVENILSILRGISSDGYPFPLREAHVEAKIDNTLYTQVLSILDMAYEETGREVLEL